MASATLMFAPKIDVPATSTFAPASTTSGAVVSSMPPSTSNAHSGLTCSIICETRRIFGSVDKKMLMPKTRIHGHDQDLVEIRQNLFQHGGGSCRVNRD